MAPADVGLAGDYEGARQGYREVLDERPNAGMPLYGIAYSYTLEGEREAEKAAYRTFLKAWSDADDDLTQIIEAKARLKAL